MHTKNYDLKIFNFGFKAIQFIEWDPQSMNYPVKWGYFKCNLRNLTASRFIFKFKSKTLQCCKVSMDTK